MVADHTTYSASGAVYAAYQVGTNRLAAIKQMDLERRPKKEMIIKEVCDLLSLFFFLFFQWRVDENLHS